MPIFCPIVVFGHKLYTHVQHENKKYSTIKIMLDGWFSVVVLVHNMFLAIFVRKNSIESVLMSMCLCFAFSNRHWTIEWELRNEMCSRSPCSPYDEFLILLQIKTIVKRIKGPTTVFLSPTSMVWNKCDGKMINFHSLSDYCPITV